MLLLLLATAAWAQSGPASADMERVHSASVILGQIMEAPDKAIPDGIMDGAKCIAIVPSMLKASFIFGANYGKGVATCRTGRLERSGLLPHQRRQLRLSGRRTGF